jgi:hypothetical protein
MMAMPWAVSPMWLLAISKMTRGFMGWRLRDGIGEEWN